MMYHGCFLDSGSLHRNDINFSQLSACFEQWQAYDNTFPQQVSERIANVHVVITNKVVLSRRVIEENPHIKLICVAATGTNNVDLEAAKACGVVVCNVRNYATASVVQHVFSLILALSNHLPEYQNLVHSGAWQNSAHFSLLNYSINEIHGKCLGVIGYGVLGRAVAEAARALGMVPIIAARKGQSGIPNRLTFERVLEQADVLSLHCPLTPETHNLINADAFARMKPGALLINTARGGVVNESDLIDALRRKRIAAAGIDVLSEEPPCNDNPLLQYSHPNLIVTPHIAWASRQARQRLVDQLCQTVRAYNDGNPINQVN